MDEHPPRGGETAYASIRKTLIALVIVAVATAAGAFGVQPTAAASLPRYLQTYRYIGRFGGPGTGNGQFDYLTQITFGPNGHLYVSDTHNARIQELTTDGTWVSTIGVASPPDWGSGNAGFDQPQGIAVSSDHVWAVDYTYGLAWFGLNGTWQGMSLGPNAPADTFALPQGAAVDSQGDVFVADSGNARVVKFDSDGAYVCEITNSALLDPVAVAVGGGGAVFVADSLGGHILGFSPTTPDGTAYTCVGVWRPGGLSSPVSIAYNLSSDSTASVFTGDSGLGQVVKLSAWGKLLAKWGSPGTGNGQFTSLLGVAVDPTTGDVYVGDRDGNRVQTFKLIDRGPKTYAKANLAVVKGKRVTFTYGVAEDVSAKATAWIKIKKGTSLKKSIGLGRVPCGRWLTRTWLCPLAKGSYRWYVYATDQGGHAQVLLGSKSLTVD